MSLKLLRRCRTLAFLAAALLLPFGTAAGADPMSDSRARAIVAPFYAALNAGGDVAALIAQATAPSWISCGGNDECRPRDAVVGSISGLHKAIPDLTWTIRDVVVADDRIIVRGEASGTPIGELLGVPYGGKSFRMMSIDVHTVRDDKIVRSYHLEDWRAAMRQLSAP